MYHEIMADLITELELKVIEDIDDGVYSYEELKDLKISLEKDNKRESGLTLVTY